VNREAAYMTILIGKPANLKLGCKAAYMTILIGKPANLKLGCSFQN
jgi:hypothetical protein